MIFCDIFRLFQNLLQHFLKQNIQNFADYRKVVSSIFEFESENFQLDDYNDDLIHLVHCMQNFLKDILYQNTANGYENLVVFNLSIICSIKSKKFKSCN